MKPFEPLMSTILYIYDISCIQNKSKTVVNNATSLRRSETAPDALQAQFT